MAMRRAISHWTIAARTSGLLLLVLTACTPHQELRSPCHLAALAVSPDCEFTPINRETG